MKLFIEKYISVLLVLSSFMFGGCKENILVNSKISPSHNGMGVYDTSLPCVVHTYFDDTAVTSTNISGIPMFQAVGTVTDPYFGTMTGATFFQLVPVDFTSTFFDNNTVDSAILILPYSGFTYGDTSSTSATQTYQVFYMADTLGYYTQYYAYNTKPIDATFPLSDPVSVNVHGLRDSIGLNVLPKNYPGLRIKLKTPTLLGHLASAQTALAGSTNPTQDFLNKFNGICVRVADTRSSAAAIPYFQLDGNGMYSQASILLYYHANGTTPSPDSSLIEPYYFDTRYCAHFNSITKSYSRYPVNSLFTSTSSNDAIIALQNQPGASIDVVIPGISKLPAGIITKAELQLSLLPGSYNPSTYGIPEKVYPLGIGGNTYPGNGIQPGLSYTIADFYPILSTSPLGILDGYVHPINRNGTTVYTYTVNIPREVMTSIKAGNDTLHLHINGTQDYYGAFHMVAGGGTYPDTIYRPRLFVVYSKL